MNERGDTLIEVTIALVILAMVLIGAFTTAGRALALGQESRNRTQLVAVAQEQAEALQSFYEQSGSWTTFEQATLNARMRSLDNCNCFHMELINNRWSPVPDAAVPSSYSAPVSSVIKITSLSNPLSLPATNKPDHYQINYSAAGTSGTTQEGDSGTLDLVLYDLTGINIAP